MNPTVHAARGARRGTHGLVAMGALLALVVGACTTGATPEPSASLPLEGTSWQLTSYVGPEGTEVPVPEGVAATATFDGGTVAGNGGCNQYTGSYTLDGDALTIARSPPPRWPATAPAARSRTCTSSRSTRSPRTPSTT